MVLQKCHHSCFIILEENHDFYQQLKRELLLEATSIANEALEIATEAKQEANAVRNEIFVVREDVDELKTNLNDYGIHKRQTATTATEPQQQNHNNEYPETSLSEDTYTFMMTNSPFTKSWYLGLMSFAIQITLLALIFHGQLTTSAGSTIFDVPFQVSWAVRTGQFLAIFISIVISYDILMPIKDLNLLWFTKAEWSKVVADIDNRRNEEYHSLRGMRIPMTHSRPHTARWKLWMMQIFFPNLLKFIQGVFVLIITFVITIKSDDTIDLFKDFAAMQVISELDNAAFHLSNHGYFGAALKKDAKISKSIKIRDKVQKICFGLTLRPLILLSLLIVMMTIFVNGIALGQINGDFFKKKYPNCAIRDKSEIASMGDGKCNGGLPNTFQCGFDDGDCLEFNIAFPNCKAINAYQVGDGECQPQLNVESCGFDGGDCCSDKMEDKYVGDKKCNGGLYNTKTCGYDGGDCDAFRKKYPLCPDLDVPNDKLYRDDETPIVMGDDKCDFIAQYMTEECGYEYGDCIKNCNVTDPTKLGDGICDGGKYNTERLAGLIMETAFNATTLWKIILVSGMVFAMEASICHLSVTMMVETVMGA